jgi:hypothetical protein
MNSEKCERYLYGDCNLLARALHDRTGWPLVYVDEDNDAGEKMVVFHVGVETPDRRFLDVAGPHDNYEFEYVDQAEDISGTDRFDALTDDEAAAVRADAEELLRETGLAGNRAPDRFRVGPDGIEWPWQ